MYCLGLRALEPEDKVHVAVFGFGVESLGLYTPEVDKSPFEIDNEEGAFCILHVYLDNCI